MNLPGVSTVGARGLAACAATRTGAWVATHAPANKATMKQVTIQTFIRRIDKNFTIASVLNLPIPSVAFEPQYLSNICKCSVY
jgi:hypothetical protein